MKTLQECYDIICQMNDDAHAYAYASWCAADEMDEESGEAEDQRCAASEEQRDYFVEMYDQLDEKTKEDIQYYRENDQAFRDDFDCWYNGI